MTDLRVFEGSDSGLWAHREWSNKIIHDSRDLNSSMVNGHSSRRCGVLQVVRKGFVLEGSTSRNRPHCCCGPAPAAVGSAQTCIKICDFYPDKTYLTASGRPNIQNSVRGPSQKVVGTGDFRGSWWKPKVTMRVYGERSDVGTELWADGNGNTKNINSRAPFQPCLKLLYKNMKKSYPM